MKVNLSGQTFDSSELYFCDKKEMDRYVMPRIYVEYRIDGDPVGLLGGSFDEVPENALTISQFSVTFRLLIFN